MRFMFGHVADDVITLNLTNEILWQAFSSGYMAFSLASN